MQEDCAAPLPTKRVDGGRGAGLGVWVVGGWVWRNYISTRRGPLSHFLILLLGKLLMKMCFNIEFRGSF